LTRHGSITTIIYHPFEYAVYQRPRIPVDPGFIESNHSEILDSSSRTSAGMCLLFDFYKQSITKEGATKTPHETVDVREPITLVERQAFLKLPIEERRKIMARQAREMAVDYKAGKVEDLETGQILDY
jgi:hypothetical protein